MSMLTTKKILAANELIPYLVENGITQYKTTEAGFDIQGYFRGRANRPKKINVNKLKLRKNNWEDYQYIAICVNRNREIYMNIKRGLEVDAFNNFIDIISENHKPILEPEIIWVMKVEKDGLYYIGKIEKVCSDVDPLFTDSVIDALKLTTLGYKFQIVEKIEIEY